MLKQRVITAILLLAVLIPSVIHPSVYPFGVVSLVLIACAAWEWSRLNGYGSPVSIAHGLLCGVVCSAAWCVGWSTPGAQGLWLIAGSFWVLAGAWLLHSGAARWLKVPQILRLTGGIAALVLAWIAVMQARAIGINFLMSVLALAWAADISAYFAGRGFGGKLFSRKLAPSISPGKTWEGVLGGVAGVIILAFVWMAVDDAQHFSSRSLYSLLARGGYIYLMLCALFMTAMSVVGDLVESLFKRLAGVKDSSGLLPGHGGVLDRVDALLPTLPLAMMLTTLGMQ